MEKIILRHEILTSIFFSFIIVMMINAQSTWEKVVGLIGFILVYQTGPSGFYFEEGTQQRLLGKAAIYICLWSALAFFVLNSIILQALLIGLMCYSFYVLVF
jgi:hypothetical protein